MEDMTWAIIKVKCSDGKTRLGINYDEESHEEDIVKGGMTEDETTEVIDKIAEEMNLEVYNHNEHDQISY